MVKKLVKDAEKHEKDLHEFYMKLRDLASVNKLPGSEDEAPMGAGEDQGHSSDEDHADDVPDLGDLKDDLGGDDLSI